MTAVRSSCIVSSALFLSLVRPCPAQSSARAFDRAAEPNSTAAVHAVSMTARSDAPRTSRDSGASFLAGLDRSQVYFDQVDGAIWAAADRYKASFDASGAAYVPYFGSCAPRNFPVRMHVDSITVGGVALPFDSQAQPARSANRVTFDRGGVVEVYDLAPESIEQSFVFDRLPAAGDLVVRLSVESELELGAAEGGTGGELEGALDLRGESGSVRYGAATAIDARGERSAAQTSWSKGAIEIRVPAERIAAASFPLTIDPILSTVTIDSSPTADFLRPDVAYDATTGRWCVVYELAFSTTDHDVYSKLYTLGGGLVSTVFVDVSTNYWSHPRVANNEIGSHYLIVAEVGVPSSGGRYIAARMRDAESGSLGGVIVVHNDPLFDEHNPVVGGDQSSVSPTYFCVVWQREMGSAGSDIVGRLVANDGTVVGAGTIEIENSADTQDVNPAIAKSDGKAPDAAQDWNIVWTRIESLFDGDLYGARIHWNGAITTPTFAIDTSSMSTNTASVSSPTDALPRKWLVAYQRSPALGDVEIFGKLYEGSSLLDTADLTLMSGSPTSEIQLQPSVDCDGTKFVMANAESVGGDTSNTDAYISTFGIVGTHLAGSEGHVVLRTSIAVENQLSVAAGVLGTAGEHRAFATWHVQLGSGNGDIQGAFYETSPFSWFCEPGADGVITCPCGNAPIGSNHGCNNSFGTGGGKLTATGDASPDSVVLHASNMMPSATCIFLQGGTLSAAGVGFGDGVRCAGGPLIRLYVKTASSGAANAPLPSDVTISARSAAFGDVLTPGTKRWYQTYYRDPASFACASPSTFNITSGVQIEW